MQNDNLVTMLRTGKLYVFDLQVAFPAAPSGGPGVWWVIRVREDFSCEAKRLLDSLPFPTSTNPDVWDYDASGKPLSKWMQYSFVAFLILVGLWMIYASIIAPLL